MGRAIRLLPALSFVGVLAATGCTAVLGDFSTAQVQDDGGTVLPDATTDGFVPPLPDGAIPDDGAIPEDSGLDAGKDSAIPLGPPGRPGQALTGGGVVAKSTNFKVFAAVGESPGGNVTAQSNSYKLQSGVIGATQ